MGRRARLASARRAGWRFPPPAPGCCRRQEDCDGLCVTATSAAPVLGERPELVTVRVREAEQRPLLRSLFRQGPRPAFGGSRSLSSPLGGAVRPLYPGSYWPQDVGAAVAWGVSCSLVPVRRPLRGPGVRSQPGCAVLHFAFSGVPLAAAAVSSFSASRCSVSGSSHAESRPPPCPLKPRAASSKLF